MPDLTYLLLLLVRLHPTHRESLRNAIRITTDFTQLIFRKLLSRVGKFRNFSLFTAKLWFFCHRGSPSASIGALTKIQSSLEQYLDF